MFKYSCFISYSGSEDPDYRKVIEGFKHGLLSQLAFYYPKADIYLDEERLRAGVFHEQALARALCESSCIVMLFTPAYFDRAHPYCAREYLTMKRLEAERCGHVPNHVGGFIVPVVLRGEEFVPNEIKPRTFESFDSILLQCSDFKRKPSLVKLRRIAQYVYDCHRILAPFAGVLAQACAGHSLPSDVEADDFLKQMNPTGVNQPLPNT